MNAEFRQSEINNQAAAWDATLRSDGCMAEQREAFEAWCNDDPRHKQAFDRLQAALATLRHHADRPDLQSLREAASRDVDRHFKQRSRFALGIKVAGFAAVSLIILSLTTPDARQWITASYRSIQPATFGQPESVGTYVTALNERSIVALPDGSSVTLNSRTRLRVELGGATRRVAMLDGQALFQVSKDPSRPFVVTAGARTITALGTEFDVRVDPDRFQVTLVEGAVAVRDAGVDAQPILLQPHDQLVAVTGRASTVQSVDVDKATAWTDGRVYFTDETLRNAATELNRYSATTLVIGDEVIARYRINGMFRVGNQEGFVNALSATYDIEASTDAAEHSILLRRRAANKEK